MKQSILVGPLALVAILLAPLAPSSARAEPAVPGLEDVTRHMDDLYRSKSSHARLTMEITTKHFNRTMSVEAWTLGEKKSLIVIRRPARQAGMATLRTEGGLWNYAPRADRLIRVPATLLSEAWMGSHFSNDDIVREISYEKDYHTTLAWAVEGGQRLLQATMIPKRKAAVVYTRVVMFLTEKGWLPVRTDYYDKGAIVRRMHYSKVRTFGRRTLPTVMEIRPTDKPKEFTRVIWDDARFDLPIESSLFTPRGLRREAQRR